MGKKKTTKAAKKPLRSGKFAKGNKAGAKSWTPSNRKKQDMLAAFKSAVSLKDMEAIAKKLVSEAKDGNAKAAKEVLDRCLGKPPQAIALTGADGETLIPIQVIIQHGEVQG